MCLPGGVLGGGLVIFTREQTPVCLLIPLVVIAAFRFGQRGVTMATGTLCVFAVWSTARAHSPFNGGSTNRSLALLMVFVVVNLKITRQP